MALSHLLKPRINELGKIKIGGLGATKKADNGREWRLPRKDDHFTVTTLHREGGKPLGNLIPDADLMRQLAADGFADEDEKIRRLPIYVLSNDIEEIMQSRYVFYSGKRVAAWSDGVKVHWYMNDRGELVPPESGFVEDFAPDVLEWRHPKTKQGFKMHTTFNCVIASTQGRWGGVHKFRTTSIISSEQLYSSLLQIGKLTNGQFIGVPIQLVVRPMQVAPDGQSTTVHVVHAELRGSDMLAIQKIARDSAKMRLVNAVEVKKIEADYHKLLTGPLDETPDDIESIEAEFTPTPETPDNAPSVDPLLANLSKSPAVQPLPESDGSGYEETHDHPDADQVDGTSYDDAMADRERIGAPGLPPSPSPALTTTPPATVISATSPQQPAAFSVFTGNDETWRREREERLALDAGRRNAAGERGAETTGQAAAPLTAGTNAAAAGASNVQNSSSAAPAAAHPIASFAAAVKPSAVSPAASPPPAAPIESAAVAHPAPTPPPAPPAAAPDDAAAARIKAAAATPATFEAAFNAISAARGLDSNAASKRLAGVYFMSKAKTDAGVRERVLQAWGEDTLPSNGWVK